jgi:hypothetical protein
MTWPSEHQGLVVFYNCDAINGTEIGITPQITLYT